MADIKDDPDQEVSLFKAYNDAVQRGDKPARDQAYDAWCRAYGEDPHFVRSWVRRG